MFPSLFHLVQKNSRNSWRKSVFPLIVLLDIKLNLPPWSVRGRTFDFWGRGGGGMDDFRRKYPADWFRGERSCKDYIQWLSMPGKKIQSPEVWKRKKFLGKPNRPIITPAQKSNGRLLKSSPVLLWSLDLIIWNQRECCTFLRNGVIWVSKCWRSNFCFPLFFKMQNKWTIPSCAQTSLKTS